MVRAKKDFRALFSFSSYNRGKIGIERERFIVDSDGFPTPCSVLVLDRISEITNKSPRFSYELSACQLEDRVGPCSLCDVKSMLEENDRIIEAVFDEFHLCFSHYEVGPSNMPVDIYPSERYIEISKRLPKETLLAACRIIGTHIHIGMGSSEEAMEVYNRIVGEDKARVLFDLGNNSCGKRIEIYKQMVPDPYPRIYKNGWQSFYDEAVSDGFAEDPRQNWKLIRISPHGTIEFRMFGATSSVEEIFSWAEICHRLCSQHQRQ